MPSLLTLPTVDGVEITTIMDNSLDLLMASTSVARRFPLPAVKRGRRTFTPGLRRFAGGSR